MTSDHFFISRERLTGAQAFLRGPEHHHLSRVLRARPGDRVWLFDEDGCRYRAKIDRLNADESVLTILEALAPHDVPTKIVLAPALLKAKTMDDVILKAAELGAFRISPVESHRSVARVETPPDRKIERWSRIAQAASKQSRSGLPPIIDAPVTLAAFVSACLSERKYVLSENGGKRLKDLLTTGGRPPAEVCVLVGPEGGWSEAEEDSFVPGGFEPITLGRTILRAETAALTVLALLAHEWNW